MKSNAENSVGTSRSDSVDQSGRALAELVTLVLSLVVVVSGLGILVYLAITESDGPPSMSAESIQDRSWSGDGNWYLPVAVHNDGDAAAENVTIEVRIVQRDESATREISLPFLSGHATGEVIAIFPNHLVGEATSVRVLSFQEA